MAQPQSSQSFSARFGAAQNRGGLGRGGLGRGGTVGRGRGRGRGRGQMGRPSPQNMQRPNGGPPHGRPPPQQGGPQAKPQVKPKPKPRPKPLSIKLRQVQIEGLVLLKIIKHAGEFLSKKQAVSGKLLGLPTNQHTVEVTNCFPEPAAFFKTV